MKRIAIADTAPAMVLARAVTNAGGLPIMAAGVALNEATIDRLKRLGISAVYIVDSTAGSGGKTVAEQEVDLERRFSRVAHDPIQTMIARSIRAYLHETHGSEHPLNTDAESAS